MSKIKIKIERDFGNEVRVQEQSEEEAPPFGEDAEMVRPGDAERMGESGQLSVINDQLPAVAVRNVRSEAPGEAAPCDESACGGETMEQRTEGRRNPGNAGIEE